MGSLENGTRASSTSQVSLDGNHPRERIANIAFFSGELPHGSKDETFRLLHVRSKCRQHPLLAAFLDLSLSSLQNEIKLLPQYLRDLVPPFENVIDLARCEQELRKGLLCGAVERIILCLLKLGLFIAYYECHPDDYSWSPQNSCSLGMGVGMLMCGAVAMAPRLSDLPAAAAETVALAFRFGVFVGDFSRSLEPVEIGELPKSYVCAIMGQDEASVKTELDKLQGVQTPKSSRVMVCNVRKCSTSIDGPPEKVLALRNDTGFFGQRKKHMMTAYGGICHAPEVYCKEHASKLTDTITVKGRPSSPVLSLVTGLPYGGCDAIELFTGICHGVLAETVRWEANVVGAINHIRLHGSSKCTILEASPSPPMSELQTRLIQELPGIEVHTVNLMTWIQSTPVLDDRPRSAAQSKLAIVGMSCRFPGGANGNEEFWDLLIQGADVHRAVPADRFDVKTHCDPTGKQRNTTNTPYGCFIDEPAAFDTHFFNMSPTEARQTDPMHRLALVTAYEALEMAGHVNGHSNIHPSRVGTFYGQASDDYREVNSGQDISTYFISGGCRAFAPGRINYFFKFSGPSYSIDTACSSALATIQEACDSLWAGNTDMIVAGGLNVLTNSDVFAGLSHGHFLSPTGGCKTWDALADGYCRADGVGTVVIKRLEDALDNNDNVLGVILSAATNHSADAVSITHPHAPTQEALYEQVMSRAGIDPLDVGYVEMHGTGTQAGDSNETTSITNVFAPLPPARQARSAQQPLYIGTVKANMGHGEAAAGSMALAKTLLVLKHGIIPPHVGIKSGLSPNFPKNLERRNLHIPFTATPWNIGGDRPRIAVINNFGAAGGNTTMLLEEGPARTKTMSVPMTHLPFFFSAKGKGRDSPSLQNLIKQTFDYLSTNPMMSPADLSYTLCARRMHHPHRLGVSATTIDDLKQKLQDSLKKGLTHCVTPRTAPRVAFIFTGQGSFYSGIARELFYGHPFFRQTVMHLDHITTNNGFDSILPVFHGTVTEDQQGSAVVQQLGILISELALVKFWEHLGVKPDVVIGHSLGEYAALVVAGVLSSSEAIFLVGQRARMLEQTCEPGAYLMLAVHASPEQISTIATGLTYEVACINGPNDTVLAGNSREIRLLYDNLKSTGIQAVELDIPYAFHSAQMDAVLHQVEKLCSALVFRKPLMPVISPLLREVVKEPGIINASYVLRATRHAVDFVGALRVANESQAISADTVLLEVGPRPICSAFVRSTLSGYKHITHSLKPKESNWATLSASLTTLYTLGVPVLWRELYRPFEKDCLSLLDLPRYPWNIQRYWIDYTGDWNLTKGIPQPSQTKSLTRELGWTTIQRVVEEHTDGTDARIVATSNILEPNMLTAIEGHKMNDVGVLSSFVHADAAIAIAKYWHQKTRGGDVDLGIELTDFDYHTPVVAQQFSKEPQLWKIMAESSTTQDSVSVQFYHPEDTQGNSNAHTTVKFGDAGSWLSDWSALAHLVRSRIDELKSMAKSGSTTQVNKKMAYRLFSKLVDYSPEYKNMTSIVLNDLEAVADISLPADPAGVWACCPYYLDAFASLPGFILNGGDAVDNDKYFYLTPHWQSLRLAQQLKPGANYQSYVRMVQDPVQPRIYKGDVYMLHAGEIIGLVKQIEFWAWKRNQLPIFLKRPDTDQIPGLHLGRERANIPGTLTGQAAFVGPKMAPSTLTPPLTPPATSHNEQSKRLPGFEVQVDEPMRPSQQAAKRTTLTESVAARALQIIAEETELAVSDLEDDAMLADLGIDSLMCLELAGRFRVELEIEVRDALFVEIPRMGDLKKYLSDTFGG